MRLLAAAAILAVTTLAAQADAITVINEKAAFPEGPAFVDGKLLYVEYGGNTILSWDGKTSTKLWEQAGCGPSAVAPLGEDLIVTCYDNGTMARVSKDGKTIAAYDKASQRLGPAGAERHHLGRQGRRLLHRVRTMGGRADRRQGLSSLRRRHGHRSGQRSALCQRRHPVGRWQAADGQRVRGWPRHFLRDRRRILPVRPSPLRAGRRGRRSLRHRAYPDGIKLGPDGNFYIGQYSKGRIVVVDGEGKFVKAIDVPSPTAPNLAFAPDGKSIYVMSVDDTSAAPYWGKVYQVALP